MIILAIATNKELPPSVNLGPSIGLRSNATNATPTAMNIPINILKKYPRSGLNISIPDLNCE